MEEKFEKIIKYSLFGLGIIFLILLTSNIIEIITNLETSTISIMPLLIYCFLIYICFKVAFNWEHIFKSLTKTFISIGIILLTIVFLLLPVGNYSNEIVDSIQPTIDTLLVSSMDEVLDSQFPIENTEIRISIGENNEIQTIENSNLKKEDIDLISETFGLENKNNNEKEIFTKIFITIIYEELSKTTDNLEIPVPLIEIKETLSKQTDLEILKEIEISMLQNFYTPNENAKVNILISENTIIKTINPMNVSENDANLIWDNLNLEDNVSIQTKKKLISLILSQTSQLDLQANPDSNIAIPITSLGLMLPEEIKPLFSYDLFSNNTQNRVIALNELRNDCNTKSNTYFDEICKGIEMTEFDNLMSGLEEISNQNNELISFNISAFVEPISSKEKILKKLENMKSLSNKFFLGYIVFLLLAIISYLLHFKLFNRELINIHIPYYISKINLITYIFNYIILLILYLIINTSYLTNWIKEAFAQNSLVDIQLFMELPIFIILKLINSKMITYANIYLIISISSFAIFYFLQKKTLEKLETENFNYENKDEKLN